MDLQISVSPEPHVHTMCWHIRQLTSSLRGELSICVGQRTMLTLRDPEAVESISPSLSPKVCRKVTTSQQVSCGYNQDFRAVTLQLSHSLKKDGLIFDFGSSMKLS